MPAEMTVTTSAEDYLDELYRRDPRTAERVDAKLNEIENDPTAAPARRHRIRPGSVWAVLVRGVGDTDDQMILWEITGDNAVLVVHIGPNILL